MENSKSYKKHFYKNISIVLLLVLAIISVITYFQYANKIELIQLKNNGHNQMMGYIIKTKNDKIIVIDGGTHDDTENLIHHINDLTGKVDYWFITHPHKDHASAIIDVIQNTDIEIGQIYCTLNEIDWYKQNEPQRADEVQALFDALENEKVKEIVHEVNLNEAFAIDNIQCKILGVKNSEITTNAINNSSMVIKMQVNNRKILFLGDTGVESGKKLLASQKENLQADIVQMAHHGQNGAEEEMYKQIHPKICMWPTPDWLWINDSGNGEDSGNWKTKTTREWIEKLQVKQNIIEKDGDITIQIW